MEWRGPATPPPRRPDDVFYPLAARAVSDDDAPVDPEGRDEAGATPFLRVPADVADRVTVRPDRMTSVRRRALERSAAQHRAEVG